MNKINSVPEDFSGVDFSHPTPEEYYGLTGGNQTYLEELAMMSPEMVKKTKLDGTPFFLFGTAVLATVVGSGLIHDDAHALDGGSHLGINGLRWDNQYNEGNVARLDGSSSNMFVGSGVSMDIQPMILGNESSPAPGLVAFVPFFGLKEVNKVLWHSYGDVQTKPILESVSGRMLTDFGVAMLPTNSGFIEFQNTETRPVPSLVGGMRRGGMRSVVLESTGIVVGTNEAGQAIGVFGVDEQGNLGGLETGLELAGALPMQFGPQNTNFENALGVYLEGVFQPLIGSDGEIFVPSGATGEFKLGNRHARVAGLFEKYISPDRLTVEMNITASGERFTLLPDGTIQDGAKIVPGLSVDKNGAITLQGQSSQVTISHEDVSFDYEKGVNVKGYTLSKDGEWVIRAGQVWIEQRGEVEPLNLEMTTEFTIEYEKMPKITREDSSSGRLRETLLTKWESEGKLTAEYLKANGIYAAKPEDWRESPSHLMGFISGSYLNVYDDDDTTQAAPFSYEGRPFRSSPEVFELIEDDGERGGMVATLMVVFERPDKTIGFEPWFYFLHQDAVGPQRGGFEAECLGFETPVSTNTYPVPSITIDPDVEYTPFRTLSDWIASGRYEAQGELLRKVISDGYPSPALGKELLTLGCIDLN